MSVIQRTNEVAIVLHPTGDTLGADVEQALIVLAVVEILVAQIAVDISANPFFSDIHIVSLSRFIECRSLDYILIIPQI